MHELIQSAGDAGESKWRGSMSCGETLLAELPRRRLLWTSRRTMGSQGPMWRASWCVGQRDRRSDEPECGRPCDSIGASYPTASEVTSSTSVVQLSCLVSPSLTLQLAMIRACTCWMCLCPVPCIFICPVYAAEAHNLQTGVWL